MSNLTQEDVVNYLCGLNPMQLVSLTKDLEKLWDVEALPQVVQTTNTQTSTETQAPAQDEFTLVLASYPPDKKMTLVKLIREVVGLGLLESKNLVESVPKPIREGMSKEDMEALKARFEEAGGVMEVK